MKLSYFPRSVVWLISLLLTTSLGVVLFRRLAARLSQGALARAAAPPVLPPTYSGKVAWTYREKSAVGPDAFAYTTTETATWTLHGFTDPYDPVFDPGVATDFEIKGQYDAKAVTPCTNGAFETKTSSWIGQAVDRIGVLRVTTDRFTNHGIFGTLPLKGLRQTTSTDCSGQSSNSNDVINDIPPLQFSGMFVNKRITGSDPAPRINFSSLVKPAAALPIDSSASDPAGSRKLEWDVRIVPGECRKEKVAPSMLPTASQINSQSSSFVAVYTTVGSGVIQKQSVSHPAGEIGRTGINSSNGRPIIEIDYPQLDSRMHLASVLGHEYSHARDILLNGFSSGDAAPLLSRDEYLSIRWELEARAFDFQAIVLDEIRSTTPDLDPCVEFLISSEGNNNLAKLSPSAREAVLTGTPGYEAQDLENAYNTLKSGNPSKKVQDAVKNYRANSLAPIMVRWSKYLPP
jgi:hypothetical protein